MSSIFIRAAFIIIVVTSFLQPLKSTAQRYEPLPKLSAQAFFPTSTLKGSNYSVDSSVKNDGYMNTYFLRSRFGNLNVTGDYFLLKRITEIQTLEFIEKNYPSDMVATKAVGGVAKRIVTAPINATKKLVNTISDGDKLKKTLKSVPSGIANIFSLAADAVGDVANSTYNTGKAVVSGESGDTSKQFAKAGELFEHEALNFVGYNRAYREIAKELKADPYTNNQLLRAELKRIASIQAAANLGGKFVPGVSVPLVGTANKYFDYAEKAATYEDPEELEKLNSKVLSTLGKSSNNGGSTAFQNNQHYTPVMKKLILDTVELLNESNVKNFHNLLLSAASAKSPEQAQFYLLSIEKIADLKKSGIKIDAVVDGVLLPSIVSTDSTLYVPLPVDYLVCTKDVAKIFNNYKNKVANQYKINRTGVLISGRLSPRCEKELRALGATDIKTGVEF